MPPGLIIHSCCPARCRPHVPSRPRHRCCSEAQEQPTACDVHAPECQGKLKGHRSPLSQRKPSSRPPAGVKPDATRCCTNASTLCRGPWQNIRPSRPSATRRVSAPDSPSSPRCMELIVRPARRRCDPSRRRLRSLQECLANGLAGPSVQLNQERTRSESLPRTPSMTWRARPAFSATCQSNMPTRMKSAPLLKAYRKAALADCPAARILNAIQASRPGHHVGNRLRVVAPGIVVRAMGSFSSAAGRCNSRGCGTSSGKSPGSGRASRIRQSPGDRGANARNPLLGLDKLDRLATYRTCPAPIAFRRCPR